MSEKQVKDLLMEHFMNPRNVGEMADADGVGDVGNPLCGDIVRLYIKIEGDKIVKATFKTFGCRAAIATSSLLTELLEQMPLADALKITEKDLLGRLGDLPPLKRHCGKLAELALRAAIGDYQTKSRGDTTLSENVTARIQDPAEWDPGIAEMDDAVNGHPL